MENKFVDYFFILEVHYFASSEMIKTAYRKLSQKLHPDARGNEEKFIKLHEAYETLSDGHKRHEYVKKWMKYYVPNSNIKFNELNSSIYNVSIVKIKNVLMYYLENIKEKNYREAYQMLSLRNQSKMFIKDYIVWQRLISEIHHLLAYDCALEDHERRDDHVVTHFKVKVKEYNRLLNRVEEDYFDRDLIYEEGEWRVLLSDINIKLIIRKYKKILALNKKNSKVLNKYLPKLEENHFTKLVSKKYFVNNSEYELLRFRRYDRNFSIVSIKLAKEDLTKRIEDVIRSETRDIDCFCHYAEKMYLILLPETDGDQSKVVIEKLFSNLDYKERPYITFDCITSNIENKTLKELLNTLLIGKRI